MLREWKKKGHGLMGMGRPAGWCLIIWYCNYQSPIFLIDWTDAAKGMIHTAYIAIYAIDGH
jgi:hypothetical protein